MTFRLVGSIFVGLACVGAPDARLLAATPGPERDSPQSTPTPAYMEFGRMGEQKEQVHTSHPDAQWFPDAAFGLFIHWGISSVRAMNISWPMIPGRPLGALRVESEAERARIVRENDYNLKGSPPEITPNEYWAMAKEFNPDKYDPGKWLSAAREAGFTYAVLTTKHHEGFALWPSAFGDFNTKNHMGGRDLVRPFVEACRQQGLRVGLYYSAPDWYFDRDYMNFLYYRASRLNPELPVLDPDLKPRLAERSSGDIEKHQAAYAAMVRGQIEELLTKYGKIDLIWFDGTPRVPHGDKVISPERIRELQPGIVINPRLHRAGDYSSFERRLPSLRPNVGWAEFCNTWTTSWSHQEIPFRAPAYVLGQLAVSRSWDINYLLGVGPTATGEMADDVYANMRIVRDWMAAHGEAIHGCKPLPDSETSSVPATSRGRTRYLFAIPKFRNDGSFPEQQLPAADETLTIAGIPAPISAELLPTGRRISWRYSDRVAVISLPAALRSNLVDVVKLELPE